MKSLGDLIKKKEAQNKKVFLDEKTAFFVFKKIIGNEMGKMGQEKLIPDYFDGKIFFVRSESSVWLSELWINRERIIKKINQELGGNLVKGIKTK